MIFTPEELQSAQNKFDKILFATTPSFLDSITKYKNQYQFADNCIGIFSSGSLLGAKTSKKAFDKFGVSPFEIFGSTETGGVAFRQQSGGDGWTIFDGVKTHTDDNGCIIADSDFCCVRPYLMSDVVEMQNEHQFLLKGRADRIVKIAEERISLPEYESKLNTHRFIEQSYVTSVQQNGRDIIGCVIVLNDDGKNFIISQGRRALVNDIKTCLAPWFPNVALPRKIRIVNEMPLNPQGKILKSEIINLLQSDMSEPVMQNLIKTDKDLSCNLTFLKDSAYFKGHFEECPILPGVIQLYFVVKFIQQFFHITLSKYDIMKLKFSNLVLPDTLVHFELHKLSDTEFSFSYENGDVKYSAGKIIIKE
jgi:3-hydroxymyristoyl/3-hydroxydecanoyl-(acyl carrier protein) dehydratase